MDHAGHSDVVVEDPVGVFHCFNWLKTEEGKNLESAASAALAAMCMIKNPEITDIKRKEGSNLLMNLYDAFCSL
ncbi:MAG: hypothetical protein PHY23_08305 [Oscillospiraceae bacterium]|jgi:hypothetical protein|nr:hypothetical protein [Oscillospiraceae bacterium]